MTADEWNREYPPGTRVSVRLFDGRVWWTWTRSEAARWGGMDHVAVEAIQPGYVLLSWCAALESEVGIADAQPEHGD